MAIRLKLHKLKASVVSETIIYYLVRGRVADLNGIMLFFRVFLMVKQLMYHCFGLEKMFVDVHLESNRIPTAFLFHGREKRHRSTNTGRKDP